MTDTDYTCPDCQGFGSVPMQDCADQPCDTCGGSGIDYDRKFQDESVSDCYAELSLVPSNVEPPDDGEYEQPPSQERHRIASLSSGGRPPYLCIVPPAPCADVLDRYEYLIAASRARALDIDLHREYTHALDVAIEQQLSRFISSRNDNNDTVPSGPRAKGRV